MANTSHTNRIHVSLIAALIGYHLMVLVVGIVVVVVIVTDNQRSSYVDTVVNESSLVQNTKVITTNLCR